MHDVIVVGAGPAGNIAARRLSGEGYDVLVLDWRENLGDKLCTGIVGRECVERYPPDEADIYREAHSAAVIAPSGKSHRIVKDEPQAYIINRVAFVASLAKRAADAGASYRLGEKVVDVRCGDEGVAVRTLVGGETRSYRARVVIIASGFSSSLLGMVGLANGAHTGHMVGCQAQVVADHLDDTEVYLGDAIAPGAFGWLVPLSGSRALVGLVSRQKLNGHMSGFLDALQQQGKVRSVTERPKRWGIPIKPLPRTFDNRVVVVGDAAGFAKPTTGGGIYYGLLSGEIAAEAIHRALAANDLSARGLRPYEDGWKSSFGRELRIGYYARLLYEALGDDQIDSLLNKFFSRPVEQEFMSSRELRFDWHSGVILKAVRHRELGKIVGSLGAVVAPLLSRLSESRSG